MHSLRADRRCAVRFADPLEGGPRTTPSALSLKITANPSARYDSFGCPPAPSNFERGLIILILSRCQYPTIPAPAYYPRSGRAPPRAAAARGRGSRLCVWSRFGTTYHNYTSGVWWRVGGWCLGIWLGSASLGGSAKPRTPVRPCRKRLRYREAHKYK